MSKAFVIKNKEGKYYQRCYNQSPFTDNLFEANKYQYKEETEKILNGSFTLVDTLEVVEITIAEGNLEQQLAEKDKEIEQLKESNGVTKALYKNYYTQLQNYKSKLYDIDIPKLRKKHLTLEEKEIYYKGFENCERQFASHIADITIEIRKQVCDEIRNYIDNEIYDRFGDQEVDYLTIDLEEFEDLLQDLEQVTEK